MTSPAVVAFPTVTWAAGNQPPIAAEAASSGSAGRAGAHPEANKKVATPNQPVPSLRVISANRLVGSTRKEDPRERRPRGSISLRCVALAAYVLNPGNRHGLKPVALHHHAGDLDLVRRVVRQRLEGFHVPLVGHQHQHSTVIGEQ